MHLFVIARGNLDKLRRWENDLAGKYFPYLWNSDVRYGGQYGMYQLGMRPIQLYEITFPKEALTDVLGMIQPYGGYGISPKLIALLRLGLNIGGMDITQIPVVPPDVPKVINGMFVPPKNMLMRDGIDVMGIGIKEDNDKDQICKVENL